MKTPDYVAAVTKIYRKYIDLSFSDNAVSIDEQDKKDLKQVFNRGGFSLGHFEDIPNQNLIFPEKPNNMGIYIGNVSNYNENKGHIKLNLNEKIVIGDTISIDGETGTYTISEIISENSNLKYADSKSTVTIGRMKGKIEVGSKVYKISSKELINSLKSTYQENSNLKKIPLNCIVIIKRDSPILVNIEAIYSLPFYENLRISYESEIIPQESINSSSQKERIIEQFSKLGNTPYYFQNLEIQLEDGLYVPHISDINDIRRKAIEKLENLVLENFNYSREINPLNNYTTSNEVTPNKTSIQNRLISVLLENPSLEKDYLQIVDANNIYIPLKFFKDKNYFSLIQGLTTKFSVYIFMPTIIKSNYRNLLLNDLDNIVKEFSIKGFVISNISGFIFLKNYLHSQYDIVVNSTMNIFNHNTIIELKKLGATKVTPSQELNQHILVQVLKNSQLPIEFVSYGRSILMNSAYCLLGKSNQCYPECDQKCKSKNQYFLKDRLGYRFPVLPDNMQTVTSIYNSKITSVDTKDLDFCSARIDILDESISEINNIIKEVKLGNRLEGKDYTSGNSNREI